MDQQMIFESEKLTFSFKKCEKWVLKEQGSVFISKSQKVTNNIVKGFYLRFNLDMSRYNDTYPDVTASIPLQWYLLHQ